LSGSSEYRDHLAVQITPRRFAVKEQYRIRISGPFIHVVDPKVANFQIMGLEREV
jgi:hypothetical protein